MDTKNSVGPRSILPSLAGRAAVLGLLAGDRLASRTMVPSCLRRSRIGPAASGATSKFSIALNCPAACCLSSERVTRPLKSRIALRASRMGFFHVLDFEAGLHPFALGDGSGAADVLFVKVDRQRG